MGRLLLFVALFVVIFFAVKKVKSLRDDSDIQTSESNPPQNMRQCEQCGIYISEKDVVHYQGKNFCSPAHKSEYHSSD